MGKKMEDLSEEEIADMNDDELATLANDPGEEEGVVEGATADAEAAAAKTTTEEEVVADDGDGVVTKDALQKLLDDGDENGMVPLSRLNEVLGREGRANEIIQLLIDAGRVSGVPAEQQEQVAEQVPEFMQYDFKAAQREYIKLISEGDEEGAVAKSEEIEDTRALVSDYKLQQIRDEAVYEAEQRFEGRAVKDSLAKAEVDIYTEFSFLNNQSVDASEAAILAVNAKTKQLIAAGNITPADALRKAAKDIGGQFAKVLKPSAGAAPTPKLDVNGNPITTTVDPRTKEAIQRGLDAKQPSTIKGGVGNAERTATIDISKMTDAQIDQLEKNDPEALAEAMGNNRVG